MPIGVVGTKLGVTRDFAEDGTSRVLTVIKVSPMHVVQVKNVENDGYSAIQITSGEKASHRVNKPAKGHFAKANVAPGVGLWEFRVKENETQDYALGDKIECNILSVGQFVDVVGTSKGKGYAGTIKRWNFAGQRNTHGNSLSHRAPGSIGQCQTPGRVLKGKKMAGRMGNDKVTVRKLEVIMVDAEKQIVVVKGLVPGSVGGSLIVNPKLDASVVA